MNDVVGIKRTGLFVGVVLLPVALITLLLLLSHTVSAGPLSAPSEVAPSAQQFGPAESASATIENTSPPGYVFRFGPNNGDFKRFNIPTMGANPHSITIISNSMNLDVWFTEPGADQLGRLVFTSTSDFKFHEYPVLSGSEPLNLVNDGEFVWFTAREGNYIGRMTIANGTLQTFTGLKKGSRPSGIAIAPNGSIWFTQMAVDQIGQLVVRTSTDYDVNEYVIPRFPGMSTESGPYGIAVERNDKIWFAETVRNQLVRLQPSVYPFDPVGAFAQTGPPQKGGGVPFGLTYSPVDGRLWFTELLGNRVTLFNLSTLSMGLQYDVPTAYSRPYNLAVDSKGRVWFTEQLGGKLGKLALTPTATFTEYPLPLANLKPQGVAVDPHDRVWLVTSTWQNVYLPLAGKNFPPPTPPFGIQIYGGITKATGLQQVIDADARWVRLPLSWSSVEQEDTTPENFNWRQYDRSFRNLHAGGIRPIVTVQGNPEWAAAYAGGPVYPDRMDDFLEFVGALVERYDGDGVDDALGSPIVDHWEFYNEQDNGSVLLAESGFGYWGHNGAGYADLLRRAWPVIKAANQRAKVLNGGIAYERFVEEGAGPYVRKFVDDFLAAGGGDYIDLFNFHYYPDFAARWAPYGQGVMGKAAYLRSKLASYGVNKPLACTELGTHSDPSQGGSEGTQSRYVVQAFTRSMAADIDITVWFTLLDITEGFPFLFGLLNDKYEPKDSYHAFSTLTEQLSGARYLRTLTVAETGSPGVEGYVFAAAKQNVYVAWSNDGANHSMRITGSEVEQVNKLGVSKAISDGDDGAVDGVVTVVVSPSPTYYRFGR